MGESRMNILKTKSKPGSFFSSELKNEASAVFSPAFCDSPTLPFTPLPPALSVEG